MIEPMQANPAFLVLAPVGMSPLSRTMIFRFGWSSLREMAVLRPTIPEPMMVISAWSKYVDCSQ